VTCLTALRLVCTAHKKVELQSFRLNDPDPDEVQIKMVSTVISPGTERANILNLGGLNAPYPRMLGYSYAGKVMKTGTCVKKLRIGDLVCGASLGHQSAGNAKEKDVICVPDGISAEHAAFTTIGVIALQSVRKAVIEIGERVAVQGLGLIGQFALQLARLNGANPTIGLDRVDSRLALASQCGADIVINNQEIEWENHLRDITDGSGPQVVFESTGYPDAVNESFRIARHRARVVLLGSARGKSVIDVYENIHAKNLTIIGARSPSGNPLIESYPHHWCWSDDATCFLELTKTGRIQIDPLISDREGIDHITSLYQRIISWDSDMMGAVLKWQ
jgi:threonine dehydrogenase-like Zn-dependent dehydrogenase